MNRTMGKALTSKNSRPTIGFLIGGELRNSVQQRMLAGVFDEAQERDINLVCIDGEYICNPVGFEAQGNILYDLVSAQSLDGLVTWGSTLGQYLDQQGMEDFYQRYVPLPIVNLEIVIASPGCACYLPLGIGIIVLGWAGRSGFSSPAKTSVAVTLLPSSLTSPRAPANIPTLMSSRLLRNSGSVNSPFMRSTGPRCTVVGIGSLIRVLSGSKNHSIVG